MACRNHPQVDMGLDHCYRCGYRFCEDCRVDFQGHPHCASCKSEAVTMLEAGPGVGDTAPGAEGELPPWERREELGMMSAFIDTMKAVLASPTQFFQRFRLGVTTWDCLAIPCVITTISMITSSIAQIALFGGMMGLAASQGAGNAGEELAASMGVQVVSACCWITAAPVLAIVTTFLMSGAIHLWLMMTSNVREPFQQTLRGYCYAQSPGILGIVPYLGSTIGGFMPIWAAVVMVRRVHGTSWGHAWMAVLWVLLVFMALGCGLIVFFIGVIGAAGN